MSGADSPTDHGGGGIRRRHSHHEYEGEELQSLDLDAHSSTGNVRRVVTDPLLGPTSATGVDGSEVPSTPTSATEHAPRVRFSADIDRSAALRNVSNTPDGPARGPSLAERIAGPRVRPGTPTLSVDTGSANNASQVPAPGAVGPLVGSPVSPHSASRLSPLSPGTRNRGYSLRSSLFRRNIEHTEGSTVIELQEVGPSLPEVERVQTARSKKSDGDVTVTVSPAEEPYEEYRGLPPRQEKKSTLRGIAALPNYQSWVDTKARQHGLIDRVKSSVNKARKFVLRINEIPPSKDGRHIDLDASRKKALTDERTGHPYIGNTIRSSRYNAWNFLPRQLFAQFSKLANFYFLCVSILQMIPGLSTTGTYTTIIPLLFFVSISIGKEGYDDLRRYKLDKAENNRDAAILHAYRSVPADANENGQLATSAVGPIHWASTKWKDLQVGDIVKLKRDEAAPADLVLLRSSGPNGIAYVETMALDGETNLKSKQTTASLAKVCKSDEDVAACRAHFVVEDPNLDLYNFEGRATLDGTTAPLTNAEIIYRGSILRNTPDAIGMVIYTGEECKIRMNANKNPRIKAPTLQSIVNKVVVCIVFFVIVLAIFNTVAYQIWSSKTEDHAWYLTNAGVAFFPILASFIIMFNTMIPLSLYVSLEIIKVAQMFLLNDIDMYDEVSNTPFEPRTSTINEELGQISYIFSDKTGTLTDNSMKFRKMSIAGTAWLHNQDLKIEDSALVLPTHKRKGKSKSKGKKPLRKSLASVKQALKGGSDIYHSVDDDAYLTLDGDARPSEDGSQWKSSARPAKMQPELLTSDLIRYIQRRPYTLFARKARLFLLSIALCHTCLPEKQEDGSIDFQASSPDELALVRAAQELGYMVIDREIGTITLKNYSNGESEPVAETFEVLDVIEFSSKRKRMSVVVRFPDQRICILCKGADSIIMQRLKHAALANQKVVEIERRASKRKSLEAQVAIARKSEQSERKSSLNRMSVTIGRASIGGLGRSSMAPTRNEVNAWLNERERDVDVSSIEDHSMYYSPRPSAQLGRPSMAISEARSSMQMDDEEDLVEEALVADESAVIERCFQHINDFATEGLRTLLYGYRFLDEQEYNGWKKVYLDATTSLVDRQDMIERAGELIEQNLDLAGATAIEDKLQKGVPEAIDKLRRANIKMWMLTGDKRETAINIGHSCRLIKDYSSVTILDHEAGDVEQHIAASIIDISEGNVAHSVVVVDGQTLALIEADPALHLLFFDLIVLVDSVVCCRASPSQKAGLVRMVRKKVKKSITLAIGDGANDIAMIQEAHVGIGITGKEGLQAARTSDYSIAQFRFLTKLLLVHGRWNYIRTCKYTVATFWKEFMFYLTQALYQRWAGYTGTSLYESWSLSMFNTLFTSLPVIFMGIFEKDLAASTLIAVPELYTKGQRNGGFNFRIYLGWIFMGSTEAMLVFFLMLGLFGHALFAANTDQSLFPMGDLCFTAIIILISTKLQVLEMHNKTVMAATSFVLSVGGWFLWNIILAAIYAQNNEYDVRAGFFVRFGRDGLWWLTLIVILAAVLVFELGVRTLRATFLPDDVDFFQQLEKDPAVKRRFEEAAALELQQGWCRGDAVGAKISAEEMAREEEISDLLRNRPGVLEEGRVDSVGGKIEEMQEGKKDRPSVEIQELLSKGFGSVRGSGGWRGTSS